MDDQEKTRQQLIDELAELRRSLDALMSHLPEGVLIVDYPDVRIRLASRDAAEMIGVSREELEGVSGEDHFRYYQAFHPDGSPAELESLPLARALFSGEVIRNEEWLIQGAGGKRFFMRCHAGPIRDRDGAVTGAVISWQDVTDLKQAEAALQKARDELEQKVRQRTAELTSVNAQLRREIEERKQAERELAIFKRFADASGRGFAMSDLGGTVTYANPVFCRMIGESDPANLIGQHYSAFCPQEEVERVERELRPVVFREGQWSGESVFLTRQGRVIPVLENVYIVADEGGQPHRFALVATDLTEWKQAEEALRQSHEALERDIAERRRAEEALERQRRTLWHLLQASDHERQVIAYEIHDGLAQLVTGAIMQFQAYKYLKHERDKAKTAFAAGEEMLQLAHAEARRLISGVRPPILDEAGLETAIAHLVHDRRASGGPKVEYKSDVQFPRLPRILENALYRIAQESLANACEHSKSARIRMHLVQEGTRLRLAVQDWGVGFDPERVGQGHFGLEGIRERVRLLQGELTIDSAPGRGTLLQVEVPIVESGE